MEYRRNVRLGLVTGLASLLALTPASCERRQETETAVPLAAVRAQEMGTPSVATREMTAQEMGTSSVAVEDMTAQQMMDAYKREFNMAKLRSTGETRQIIYHTGEELTRPHLVVYHTALVREGEKNWCPPCVEVENTGFPEKILDEVRAMGVDFAERQVNLRDGYNCGVPKVWYIENSATAFGVRAEYEPPIIVDSNGIKVADYSNINEDVLEFIRRSKEEYKKN